MNQIIQEIEAPLIKTSLPTLSIGDTVKVFVKIKEGGKERTQGYEGVIIKRHGSGVGATVTVRRVFQGIGIEPVFQPVRSEGAQGYRQRQENRPYRTPVHFVSSPLHYHLSYAPLRRAV